MKKAVIFDMDGVIIDSEITYQKRRTDFFAQKGINLTAEQQQAFVGTNPDDMLLSLFPDDEKERAKVKAEFIAFRDTYELDIKGMLNPEIEPLLSELKKNGYRLAVASSGVYDHIVRVLEVTNLLNYFELVVSGQMFAKSKPHPEIYTYTVSKLGLQASECLAIEDSEHGVNAARGAGIDVLGLVNESYKVDLDQATDKIHSLKEVPNWLKN